VEKSRNGSGKFRVNGTHKGFVEKYKENANFIRVELVEFFKTLKTLSKEASRKNLKKRKRL